MWGWAAAAIGAVAAPVFYAGGQWYMNEPITWQGVVSAAAGGATAGFIAGTLTGDETSIAGLVGIGMLSGGAGAAVSSATQQGLEEGALDAQQLAHDTAFGAVIGGLTAGFVGGLSKLFSGMTGGGGSPALAGATGDGGVAVATAPAPSAAAAAANAPPMTAFAPLPAPGIVTAHSEGRPPETPEEAEKLIARKNLERLQAEKKKQEAFLDSLHEQKELARGDVTKSPEFREGKMEGFDELIEACKARVRQIETEMNKWLDVFSK